LCRQRRKQDENRGALAGLIQAAVIGSLTDAKKGGLDVRSLRLLSKRAFAKRLITGGLTHWAPNARQSPVWHNMFEDGDVVRLKCSDLSITVQLTSGSDFRLSVCITR
jgi:hypothetical protein